MQTGSDLAAATEVWNDPSETTEHVVARIHDGFGVEWLPARAETYVNSIFDLFPYARPKKDGAAVMEIGSGVGYIMEAISRRFVINNIVPTRIIGLDIAEHMIARAKARLGADPIFSFLHYDGIEVPLPDRSLDFIYSVASLQHVPRPYVFNLFFEVYRLLKHGGYAVLHLHGVKELKSGTDPSWRVETTNQINRTTAHWHHYYSAEELEAVFRATGFEHVDIRDGTAIWSLVAPVTLDGL